MHRINQGEPTLLDKVWAAPWRCMERPDPWQRQVLIETVTLREDCLLNCSRQSGKTTVISAAAYANACLGEFVLVVSASDRQAVEFMERVRAHHYRTRICTTEGDPAKHEMKFGGGGRILALPCREATIRGFSAVDLLIVDEASKVPDAVYNAVRPMLITSGGRTVLLSTPFGRRGFFYEEWKGTGTAEEPQGGSWRRHRISWRECPRIRPQDLEKERERPGVIVEQEFLEAPPGGEFLAETGAFFDAGAWENLIDDRGDLRSDGFEMEW